MTDTTATYITYLRDIATEAPDRPIHPPTQPDIPSPATFLLDFLQSLLPTDTSSTDNSFVIPITRHGMDAALDTLFSHPALRPLLLDDNTSNSIFPTRFFPPSAQPLPQHSGTTSSALHGTNTVISNGLCGTPCKRSGH